MEIDEILSHLEYNTGPFPRDALQEAIRQQEQITPRLLSLLSWADENIECIADHPDYMAHLYAMFLLAQFRQNAAYPLIVRLFSHPGDLSDRIAEEFITEDLPRVLASVCDSDTSLLTMLIENNDVYPYVRGSCIHALLILVVAGKKTREETIGYYQSLFQGRLPRTPSVVWDSLVLCSCDLGARELSEDIKKAFMERLVDRHLMSLSDAHDDLAKVWGQHLEDLRSDRHHQLVDDTISSMEWWACFDEYKQRKTKPFIPPVDSPVEQRRRTKIGRNKPCPCGSGKKYKKCCGSMVKPVTSSKQ